MTPTPKDRGIIFSPPMVRALVAGKKTQTRRLASSHLAKVQPGDRLWVKETSRWFADGDDCELIYTADGSRRQASPNEGVIPDDALPAYYKRIDKAKARPDRVISCPSIFMARWASRLTLIVTDVRFQPLLDIDGLDATEEGATWLDEGRGAEKWGVDGVVPYEHPKPVPAFLALWDGLHQKPGERSSDNPGIVALTFTVARYNIDRGGK